MFHTIRLSKSNPTPLYIQLACELSKLIQMNILTSGMKLPTIRSLSSQLCINRDTVVSAYKLLENQGLVESYIGKGTYIASKLQPTSPANLLKESSYNIYCSHLGTPKAFFTKDLCLELTRKVAWEDGWECFNDPLYRERQLIKYSVSHFFQQLGYKNHFAQIKLIQSKEDFLLQLFKYSPKTGICCEAIRDLSLSCYLRSIGAKIYEIPLTSEGMDLKALEKCLHTGNVSYIFISSVLHNPTGICYCPDTLKQLILLAKEYNCYIVDDITYASFVFEPISLCKDISEERIIYIHQFSKIYLPYIHFTFAILPAPLYKHLVDQTECSFNERLLRHYLTCDTFSELQHQLFERYQNDYQYFYNLLQEKKLPLRISTHIGGLWFWLQIPIEYYDALCDYLTKHHIIVSPGDLFSNLPLSTKHIRLSISQLSMSEIQQVIAVFDSFFKTYSI